MLGGATIFLPSVLRSRPRPHQGRSPEKVERMIDRYVKRDEIMLDEIRRINQVEGKTKVQN